MRSHKKGAGIAPRSLVPPSLHPTRDGFNQLLREIIVAYSKPSEVMRPPGALAVGLFESKLLIWSASSASSLYEG